MLTLFVLATVTTLSCSTSRQNGMVRRAMSIHDRSALLKALGLEFVYIPGGSFAMGQTLGEAGEKPVHEVSVRENVFG